MASVRDEVGVYEYSGGIVGPGISPAATVRDGGIIRTGTPPGCWGPMITPKFQGGHEVTRPVLVEGAEIGDAIAIRLRKVRVTSLATSSGVMEFVDGRYVGEAHRLPLSLRAPPEDPRPTGTPRGAVPRLPPLSLVAVSRVATFSARWGLSAGPMP